MIQVDNNLLEVLALYNLGWLYTSLKTIGNRNLHIHYRFPKKPTVYEGMLCIKKLSETFVRESLLSQISREKLGIPFFFFFFNLFSINFICYIPKSPKWPWISKAFSQDRGGKERHKIHIPQPQKNFGKGI